MKNNLRKLLAALLSLMLLGGTLTALAEAPEEPVVAEKPVPEPAPEPVPEPVPEPMPEPVPEPAPEVPEAPVPEPAPEAPQPEVPVPPSPEAPVEPEPGAPEVPPAGETEAPAEPSVEPDAAPVPEPLLPAEALAAELGITIEDLAGDLGVTVDELLLMDEDSLNELYTRLHADEYSIEPIASDGFEIDENGVLTKYTGSGGDIVIPDGVIAIGEMAFSFCHDLTSVVIPASVTSLGRGAFFDCQYLTRVEIPDGVTYIGEDAFNDCLLLTDIVIPAGVTRIEPGTFVFCSSLKSIHIPSGVTEIGDSAFEYCSGLVSLDIPSGVTRIGQYAFWRCNNLADLKLYDTITDISDTAFNECPKLSFTICVRNMNEISYPEKYCKKHGFAYRKLLYGDAEPAGQISFSMSPTTINAGEPVGFRVTAPNAERVQLIIDGVPSDEYEMSANPLTVTRAFDQVGGHQLQFRAFADGAWGEACAAQTLTVLEDRPANPVLKLSIVGAKMTADWDAVEGAASYVYILRNLTDDILLRDHAPVNGALHIEEQLETGKKYRLSVGAVPGGTDSVKNPELCGWGLAEFETDAKQLKFQILSPVNGQIVPRFQPLTLSWTPVAGASQYVVLARYDKWSDGLYYTVPGSETSYTLEAEMLDFDPGSGTRLCLRVQAWDDYDVIQETEEIFVTAEPQPTGITLNRSKLTLGVGETAQLTYELQPVGSTATVTFESTDKKIATVDVTGLVTARRAGTVNIKARTDNGLVARCTVTVKAAPTRLTLEPRALTLSVGQEGQLKATLSGGSAGTLTWASDNEGVATVDAGGKVTAVAVGQANVTVTAYNYDASKPKLRKTCVVTVEGEPQTLDAGVADVTLGVGEKLKLTPTVKDASGKPVTNVTLSYRSGDTGIATVNANGRIVAVKAGTTAITITANNGPSATVNVTVKAAPRKLEITNSTNKLGIGEAWTVGARLTGKAGADSAGKVTFSSSNAKVLGVNADTGVLNAKAAGSAKITAKAYNGVSAAINVTVKAAPKEIRLDKSTLTMGVDEPDIKLTASFRNANQFGHVTWTSDAENIVTVDRGLLTAKAPGVANITASVYNPAGGSFTAQCKVTVKAKPTADKMTLSLPRGTIGVGEKLTATLAYADDVGGAYKFASSNKNVATVNAVNGKIKGLKAGRTVTISAIAYNEAKVEQQLEVVAAPTKVRFVDKAATMTPGEAKTLIIQVLAGKADITGKVGVTYSTNKPDILEVNPTTGEVSAKAVGAARITVTAYNGISTTVRITVQ